MLSHAVRISRIQYRVLLGVNWTLGWNASNLLALYSLANTTSDGEARCVHAWPCSFKAEVMLKSSNVHCA